jgi:hypothetical protein
MRQLFLVSLTLLGFIAIGTAHVRADEACDAIIDKAIKATGGLDKLSKIKGESMKGKGKVSVMGMEIPYTSEHVFGQPDKMKAVIEAEVMGQKFTFAMILNGKKGWRSIMGQTMDMDDGQVAEQIEAMHVHQVTTLVPLKDKAYMMSPLGESNVEGKPAVGIKVSYKGRRDVNIFFDKEAGYLVKTSSRAKDDMSGQDFNQDMFFLDYKDKDGYKVSMKMKIHRDGAPFLEQEVTEYKVLDKVDENDFAKP